MVYAKSLLAFVFSVSIAALAATPRPALATTNPCSVTPNGSGGWNVTCAPSPAPTLAPIVQTFNGSPDPAGSGHVGTVIVSPGDGGSGNPGQDATLDLFPAANGLQAIEDFGGPTPPPQYGIFIQSKGANGGSGGDADVCACGGGKGGSGGQGGNVTVTIEPTLTVFTDAFNEPGIFVQSAGGNGGNGGDGNGSFSAGDGGVGGIGGSVSLTIFSSVVTVGANSDGVIAQSIGGGGGTGGGGLNFSGGSGGPSENGGDVTVNLGALAGGSAGSIATYGDNSVGLLAQSIGGYGGVGGSSFGLVSVSGGGGNGGNGGTVNVTTSFDSSILTFGAGSTGLIAESIGGAGGSGGDGGALFFGGGGSGSVGGNGGSVTVHNGAAITTNGAGAIGILAQSIGGGGGNGGTGVGIFGLGGSGSSTSPGGSVSIVNTGDITTNTTSALSGGTNPLFSAGAIFAQSIGGGGGNGGTAVGLFAVGGSGGGGGDAGTVNVNNNATLVTNASDSNGIFAQSIGGGGGNGGGSVAASAFFSFSVGGSAGVGGNGADTSVVSNGTITTSGDRSNGIFAQSIGGGGGNGGFAVDAAGGQVGFAIGVGGTGGGGGSGASVSVTGGTHITTSGDSANGILAQSIGGGGGSGGFAIAAGGGIGAASFSLGGSGGNGGDSGNVTVANSAFGIISTSGNDADGILAQSIGGGGGNGGFSVSAAIGAASAGLAVGGEGAGGGDAGTVSLTNSAIVSTSGSKSDALAAQSIGGGGGNGGFSVGASASLDAGAGLSIGGGGAGGGNGGAVTLDNDGALTAQGDQSAGLFAQSLGGGGGNGGFSVAGALSLGPAASVGIGGTGGGGGNGGQVHVTNTGAITTFGSKADALSAQSIGGGGGNGGWSVAGTFGAESGAISIGVGGFGGDGGNGDLVSVTNGSNPILTYGSYSNGIDAQSIGGGGGNGGFNVAGSITGGAALSLSLGGFGGGGGTGGEVDVTNHSDITTGANLPADFANGILAESIGGGGGSGGFSVAGTLSQGIAGDFNLGGFGGSGGDSGNVSVTNSGAISTNGEFANGISAQSIGGGGGAGGFAFAGALANNSGATLGLGGNGGTAGNAGTVSVTNTNDIVTFGGTHSNGILAQSIGGGGGLGGWSAAFGISGSGVQLSDSFGGNGGGAGSGNTVTVNSGTANGFVTIVTHGAASNGILAQSIGGGGGDGGITVNVSATGDGDGEPDGAKYAMQAVNLGYGILSSTVCPKCPGSSGGDANNGGDVNVTSFSNIETHGDHSSAIAAQSIGGGGGMGAITVGGAIDKTGPSVQIQFGSGGGGGDGADVTVDTVGTLVTHGSNADGILAQSVGGGGGYGGLSGINGLIGSATGKIGLSFGQTGDQGGNGGKVTVTTSSSISTDRGNSGGIVAQSIGGGGGDGGFAIQGGFSLESGTPNSIFNYAFGSNGGAGGNGGEVDVTSTGTVIQTQGARSDGILAQSIGGGGGDGGFAINGAYTPGWAMGFSLGGSGGSTGNGGQVNVTNSTQIVTNGDLSGGIVAQSIGGGGGNGGFAFEGLGTTGFTATAAVGGSSSGGGNANQVVVNNSGAIGTLGESADAILAQSIGGGGGNGGAAIAGGVTTSNSGTFFSFGASGGSGGNGSNVNVTNSAQLVTRGENSADIAAQSLGGGGGNGGFSIVGGLDGGKSFDLALGGSGGSGGAGSVVSVSNSATLLSTTGNSADGILAQSIGGGGGNGGFALGATAALGKYNLALAFGGNGGTGGTGDEVTVTNEPLIGSANTVTISTTGAFSDGILAQSIGGGGGNGGWTVDGLGDAGASLAFSLGGSGGSGNDANQVIVNSNALIQTTGMAANGITAQSIGGGGGSGGFNEAGQLDVASGGITAQSKFNFGNGGGGANSANVLVDNSGQIVTTGENANGILAQSIGGGGGYGGFSYGTALLGQWGIGLGSATAGGGTGAAVTVNNNGTIATSGDNAAGVIAQSIGGGGGEGGFAWSAGLNSNISSPTANVGWALGSNGGSGGNGGLVSVTNNGLISTTGANAAGIIAQSIGGGGGNGGNATTALASATQYFEGFNLALGGNAGTSGSGGIVTVTNNGTIQTTGALSDGIIAQSIGGGGGNGGNATSVIAILGLDESLAYGGAGGSGGAGGNVTVTNSGSIVTTGFGSNPIVAQSIGGGGGTGGTMVSGSPFTGGLFGFTLGGNNGGTGASGTVTIANTGILSTGGMFATDLLTQSVGGGGGTAAVGILDATHTTLSGLFALGATGGTPGNGTAVNSSNVAQLTSSNLGSNAMLAQSVGGGGGVAGIDIALNATDATVGGLSFGESNVLGAAGNAAAVTASDDAVLATSGDASDALLAQSVSAGGGFGVLSIGGTYSAPSLLLGEGASIVDLGSVGNVGLTSTSNVQMQTLGVHSTALIAQSIAGGGGVGSILIGGNISSTSKIGYALGATGTGAATTGGTGAMVTVSNSAQKIITKGDLSGAILAQSIGGGGGDAAFKFGGTISNAALSGVLGGSRLTAGTGGAVNVTNNGYIGESGNGSIGILAQSIGGGGGIGGFDNVSGTLPSVAYTLGGTSEGGTLGGASQIANTGQIVTTGIGDAAAVAQSIGGGGGEEGYALNLGLGTAATTLSLLAGGTGGNNDIGGAVTFANSAQIATGGNFAPDLLAQSIGDGGGNGGMSAAGNLTTSGPANQFKLQLGGSSGTGNDAGTVQLTSTIVTAPSTAAYIANGDQSAALEAQSIGGGGGNASLSFNGAFSSGTPNAALVQIGGTKGGNGNTVTMSNTGSIATGLHTAPGVIEGMFSYGLIAQSIGGGGGNGVLSMDLGVPTGTMSAGTVTVNVGGKAGGNGNGAAVNITNSGKIQTIGHEAIGIVAQSIGGGGGNGAAVIFGNKTAPPPVQAQYRLNVNVGGVGSTGNGGDVTVTNSAPIITEGNSGPSILAQSIGGGGGNGGPVRSLIESHPTQCFTAVPPCSARLIGATITVGGSGSSGSGGNVTVNNKANLGTGGQNASGIIAQSIGGGGGIAGDANAGHGGWDISPNDVPGGTLKNWSLILGGSHSTGNGGIVNVTDTGSISTQGDGSFGIIAQSIGGGGGIGGLGLGAQYGGSGSIAIGGSGSSSGNGGAVNVAVNNSAAGMTTISTHGTGAYGIFAQSVGGGGGFMGEISPGINKTVIGKGSKLISSTGSGGNGGTVTVVNNGAIETTGAGAEGIFAQSIGGGGGLLPGYAGTANLGGVAGAVSVTQNGVIETLGNNADAIFAQSAGGKGAAGNVSVTVTGMALAYGANSDGVTAQSVGGNGNGNISVTVNSNSVVQGGTGNGSAGVRFLNGKNNSLVNKGTITTASAANAVAQPMSLYETGTAIEGVQDAAGGSYHTTSLMTDKSSLLSTFTGSTAYSAGTAVYANSGTLNINNQGSMYGSLVMSGANLNFTNAGTFVSGSQVNLGTGTMSLASGGVMAAGAGGFVATTDILGNFIEQTGSDYLVTLDLASSTASLLNISGTASLGGSIDLDLLSTNAAAPGSHSETIVTAGGGLTGNGAALAPPQSAVATFNLDYLPNALQLNYDVNYAPASGHTLNMNDLAFGNYIGAIQTAGSAPQLASFMSDVFAVPTIPKLKTFYDRFTPGASVALGSSTLLGNLQFSSDILRCRDDGIITRSGNCSWARLGSESSHQSGTFSSVGYGRSGNGFAYGFEHRIGNGTSIGAAIHYTRSALFDDDSGSALSGNGLEAGISASRMRHDGVLLSADFLAGEGHYDSVRRIGYPAIVTTASGSQAISYIGTHVRAEKRFGGALKAITPFVDAGLTRVNVGALFESGAGTLNENVAPYHAMYPTISSGVRLEDSRLVRGSMLHGTLDLSITQLVGNPQTMTTATLAGAPSGVPSFAVTNTLDRTQFAVAPALDITRGNKTNIRIGAGYTFSRHTHSGGAYIEFSLSP